MRSFTSILSVSAALALAACAACPQAADAPLGLAMAAMTEAPHAFESAPSFSLMYAPPNGWESYAAQVRDVDSHDRYLLASNESLGASGLTVVKYTGRDSAAVARACEASHQRALKDGELVTAKQTSPADLACSWSSANAARQLFYRVSYAKGRDDFIVVVSVAYRQASATQPIAAAMAELAGRITVVL